MTAPAALPKRADELAKDDRVMVPPSTAMTVDNTRPGQYGDVEIRWAGSPLWASVPADRMFDVIEEAPA